MRGPRPAEAAEHRLRAFDPGLGEHDRELLTAVASDAVDLAGRVAQVGGQQAQGLVAHLVSVPVVDLLEVVEIDEHERVAGLHRRQRAGEGPAVGELGQRIGLGVVRELGRLAGRRNMRPASSDKSSAAWLAVGGSRRRGVVHIAMATPIGVSPGPGSGTVETAHTVGRRRQGPNQDGVGHELRGVGIELTCVERVDEERRRLRERGVAEERTVEEAAGSRPIGEQDRDRVGAEQLGRQ